VFDDMHWISGIAFLEGALKQHCVVGIIFDQ